MCMTYELLTLIMTQFLSLKKSCQTLMQEVIDMTILYIGSIDDENFLNLAMLETDYEGRDSLDIAIQLELLRLIQAPKVQAIIKSIYYSKYE